ncbi:lamin tail domain-containing protein [bacterium]|nr:lamin tail domain-containing protein [bacterium]
MKSLFLIFLVLAAAGAASAQTPIYFSEYVEGSSNNKAVEIYNATNVTLDLSRVRIERYNNGSLTVGYTANLEGTLAAGDVWVIVNASAVTELLALADDTVNSTFTFYNGDDCLLLYFDDVLVDSIGRLGEDPGTFWGTEPVTTAEHTLVRKVDACTGDTDTGDAYDPADDYDGFAQDDFTHLGSHTTTCGVVADEVSSFGAIKSLFR